MAQLRAVILLTIGVAAGAAGSYWYARPQHAPTIAAASAASPDRKALYYRDPTGAPYWSAVPKKDASGREYVPVYDDEEPAFGPGGERVKPPPAKGTARTILYYRNPMGLPDISPVPKKDPMGMDYIAVYAGDEPEDGGKTVRVSLDKVQRSGVRTEAVQARVLVHPVRAVGTVAFDESRQTIVTLRSDGFIEDLFVNTTGRVVQAGEPLFRLYSPQIQIAQIDLMVAVRSRQRGQGSGDGDGQLNGAMQRLRNLAVPESRIRAVVESGANPRTLDWPSPATGTVVSKRIINGQRVLAGDELYRIVDLTRMWVIADVAEADLGMIKTGIRAVVTFRAYPADPIEGTVTFIYPEVKTETRTARVRIEVANPEGRLKADMYADVVFHVEADAQPVLSVPASAVIDSGSRQVVLVTKSEGRFEPRPIKLGRRGDGYAEVLDGLGAGEEVVTSAMFLIDAESNLRAALQAFTQSETPK